VRECPLGRSTVSSPQRLPCEVVHGYAAQYRARADPHRFVEVARPLLRELRDCYRPASIDRPVLLVRGVHDRLTSLSAV